MKTEDTQELRALKNIDFAFVSMNVPYTMSVEQAASAVLKMKPGAASPYHYRNSDLQKSKRLMEKNPAIEVHLLDCYSDEPVQPEI